MTKYLPFLVLYILFGLVACSDDDTPTADPNDLTTIAYTPEAYTVALPAEFPPLEIPTDNPLTKEGVQLGRRLFYDPILSADSTMSCASCHQLEVGFADPLPTSVGIDGIAGTRSGMSLLNIAYSLNGLNWDGKIASLEEQALEPVTNEIELHESWPNVIEKLKRHTDYPSRFRKAFGIENKSEITKELAAKAIAQFERIILTGANSKYDRVLRGEAFFTDEELNGFDMFFDISPELPDAECGHCHNGALLSTNEYFNNGIDNAPTLDDFIDKGRGEITGIPFDNGRFRATTLRNIEFTAPYMHDGRFQTLEEVVDHYNSGGKYAPNLDPLILPLGMTDSQKQDLVAFLKTFSDTSYQENPDLQNPFE